MKITIDEIDRKILAILSENARLSYAEIGRKIGLSQSATKERVLYLVESGVIKGFGIEIDYEKLGYGLKVVLSMKFKQDEYKTFITHLAQFPEIRKCKRITGESCLIATCVLKDSAHLENLIDRLLPYGTPTTAIELSELRVKTTI